MVHLPITITNLNLFNAPDSVRLPLIPGNPGKELRNYALFGLILLKNRTKTDKFSLLIDLRKVRFVCIVSQV